MLIPSLKLLAKERLRSHDSKFVLFAIDWTVNRPVEGRYRIHWVLEKNLILQRKRRKWKMLMGKISHRTGQNRTKTTKIEMIIERHREDKVWRKYEENAL